MSILKSVQLGVVTRTSCGYGWDARPLHRSLGAAMMPSAAVWYALSQLATVPHDHVPMVWFTDGPCRDTFAAWRMDGKQWSQPRGRRP